MKKWINGLKKSFAEIEIAAPDHPQEIDWKRIDEDRQRLMNMRFKGRCSPLPAVDPTEGSAASSTSERADECEPVRSSDRKDIMKRWHNEAVPSPSDTVKQLQENELQSEHKSEHVEENFPAAPAHASTQPQSNGTEPTAREVQSDSARFWLSQLEGQPADRAQPESVSNRSASVDAGQPNLSQSRFSRRANTNELAQIWLSQVRNRPSGEAVRPASQLPYQHAETVSEVESQDAWRQLCDDPVYKALMELEDAAGSESAAIVPSYKENPHNEQAVDNTTPPAVLQQDLTKSIARKTMRKKLSTAFKSAKSAKGSRSSVSAMQKRMASLIAQVSQQLQKGDENELQSQIAMLRSRTKPSQPAPISMASRKKQQTS